MQRIEWTEALAIGIKSIDDQHMELVRMLNDLLEAYEVSGAACPAEDLVARLKDYAARHFHVEEGYMQAFAYPEYEQHLRQHQEFLEAAARYEFGCANGSVSPADIIVFLQDWLTKHIIGTDRKMGGYLSDYLR